MADSVGSCLLLQFAREPVVGAVKTRMMPHLSAAEACDLHCELVLWTTVSLLDAGLGPVEMVVAGAAEHPLFMRCRHQGLAGIGRQRGDDLGERMYHALADGLLRCERVILVGSDCPGIDRQYLHRAVRALDSAEVVLGPALDGGYVMVGARRINKGVFEGIVWGSDTVMASTRERLRQLAVNWTELPPLTDIDRPEDLPVWQALRRAAKGREGVLRR
jgi:rSAM/selenodomain-associated transferase 1